MNHQLILKFLFERMNKSVIENDNKTLGKLLYVIQAIIQDSSNTKYIDFLKQQAKLFENIFNKNINKMINVTSAEIYKSLTNTNLMKAEEFLNENNNTNNNNVENNNNSGGKNAPNPLDAFINKANQKIAKFNNNNNNNMNNVNNENSNEEKKFNFIKKKNEENNNNNFSNNNYNKHNNMFNYGNNNLLTNIEDDIISNINNNLNINNNSNQNNNNNQANTNNNQNNNQNLTKDNINQQNNENKKPKEFNFIKRKKT